MKFINKLFLYLFLPVLLLAAAAVAGAYYWMHSPLKLPSDRVDVLIPAGTTPAGVSKLLKQAGIEINSQAFVLMSRLAELDKKLKAGGYQIVQGDSPWLIVKRMANGDMTQRQVTFVEGWSVKQIRSVLSQHADVKQTLAGLTDEEILSRLDPSIQNWLKSQAISSKYLEGLFFPDTYIFPIGTTDLEILQRASRAQIKLIDQAWIERQNGLPLKRESHPIGLVFQAFLLID